MAKKTAMTFANDFAFYEQLWEFYSQNRGKIRSRYNDLTRKFLAYNDRKENPNAFLREPHLIIHICMKSLTIGETAENIFLIILTTQYIKAVR